MRRRRRLVRGSPPQESSQAEIPATTLDAPTMQAPGTPAPPSSPAVEPRPGPVDVLKAAASVVAPLTVITALMYYFGLIHAYHFFGSFGVDYSLFDLSTQDYVIRSADGLFVPFTVIAAGILVVAWIYQLLLPDIRRVQIPRLARVMVPLLAVTGTALVSLAAVGVVDTLRFFRHPWIPGVALVAGVLAMQASTRTQHWLRDRNVTATRPPRVWAIVEWTAVVLLVGTGLFWAVGDWSATVGQERGRQVEEDLPTWPNATLYSERPLSILVPGVTETACAASNAAFGYRYDGLHLILQEGGQLLFLPDGYLRATGTAIVIPRSDSLRLDFTRGEATLTPAC